MLQRIRLAMQNGTIEKMSGRVESDESFIGGRSRFMHKARKKAQTGWKGMTPVQGLLERTTARRASRVKLKVLKTTRKHEVQANVREYVLKGSEVHTDAHRSVFDAYVGKGLSPMELAVKFRVPRRVVSTMLAPHYGPASAAANNEATKS